MRHAHEPELHQILMFAFPPARSLSFLALAGSVYSQGLNAALEIEHISVALTGASILSNQASLNFDVTNSMPTPVTITHMSAGIGSLGLTILSFNQEFTSFIVPASGSANSGTVPNVTLTEGTLSLLEILLLPTLDVIDANVTVKMQQDGIPSNITLT